MVTAPHRFRNDVWADDPEYWARCPVCGRKEDGHDDE